MRTLFLAAVMVVAQAASAQEPAFEALGQAPVVGGDRVRARERALDEALRQAVEQAVGTVLTPDELVQRASQLKLRIYPRARNFVTIYRILDEGEAQPNLFQVHVSAQVSTAQLSRELQQPSQTQAHPGARLRGLVCVEASGPPESAPAEAAQAAERTVRDVLAARNVEVVARPRACTPESAAEAARQEVAQAAVVGTAAVEAAGPIRGTALEGAHARLQLKLLEPSGRVSASGDSERDAYGPGLAPAGQAATREATAEVTRTLAPHLATVWSAAPQGMTGGVTVRLFGMSRFADYQSVQRALASLPGVAAVEPRLFQRGAAELLVRTAAGASQLESGLTRVPPVGVHALFKAQPDGSLRVDIAGETAVPERG